MPSTALVSDLVPSTAEVSEARVDVIEYIENIPIEISTADSSMAAPCICDVRVLIF